LKRNLNKLHKFIDIQLYTVDVWATAAIFFGQDNGTLVNRQVVLFLEVCDNRV